MTHLPECLMNLEYAVRVCICTELRACEQRMLDDDVPAAAYHGEKGYTMGYLAALDAAEIAIQKATQNERWCCGCYEDIEIVLTAIRSLKEKP